jgi:hypothetical protein
MAWVSKGANFSSVSDSINRAKGPSEVIPVAIRDERTNWRDFSSSKRDGGHYACGGNVPHFRSDIVFEEPVAAIAI